MRSTSGKASAPKRRISSAVMTKAAAGTLLRLWLRRETEETSVLVRSSRLMSSSGLALAGVDANRKASDTAAALAALGDDFNIGRLTAENQKVLVVKTMPLKAGMFNALFHAAREVDGKEKAGKHIDTCRLCSQRFAKRG